MDTLNKEKRSWNMSHVKSKDTTPELFIRSLLHRAGYRFRLHVKNLPGKPDIVLPKYKIVIEVRGCFWHHHRGCPNAKIPETRHKWWNQKLIGNEKRDKKNQNLLIDSDWHVLIIWECFLKQVKYDNMIIEKAIMVAFHRFSSENIPVIEISSGDNSKNTGV